MKSRGLAHTDTGRIRALEHRRVRSEKAPAIKLKGGVFRDPTVCEGCGAVYTRKTWRRSRGRRLEALLHEASWAVCPACTQVKAGRFFGRVLLRGAFVPVHEEELRRRVMHVAERAGFTEPERRLVSWKRAYGGVEIKTTSQKLAHRIARELEKAFRGKASYSWSDRDGRLTATWERD